MRVTGTHRTIYGTRFDSAALELLPQSGSVYGLIERGDPLVVTERIEGGGAYPEPQRLGASGASWTQTSFRLGDVDITDPDRTGFAMIYPNLDTLQAVSVITAGLPMDGYGGGTSVMLVPRMPAPAWQREIEFAGSPPAFQSVNPLPAAPSIGRLRAGAGGSFVASGPVSDRLGLLVAGALARSSRLERDRQSARREPRRGRCRRISPTRRRRGTTFGCSRRSTACRSRLTAAPPSSIPALERQSRSTLDLHDLESHRARRPRVVRRPDGRPRVLDARVVRHAHRRDDGAAARRSGLRAGLVVGQQPSAHVRQLAGRPGSGALAGNGGTCRSSGRALSWTGVTRNAPGASLIGELVDGQPARAWRYATDGAPSRWSGLELAFWATNEIPVTSRVDIDLGLRGSFASASRDGSRRNPVARAVAERQRHLARPSERSPDVPARRRAIRRASALELPQLRRSACA